MGSKEEIKFKGTITKIRSESERGTIADLELSVFRSVETRSQLWRIKGEFAVNIGDQIEGTAEITSNVKWGRELVAKKVTVHPFYKSDEGMMRFLSTEVDRIGKETAKALLSAFPVEVLVNALDNRDSTITSVKGIGEKTAERIWDSWEHKRKWLTDHLFLDEIGIRSPAAKKLIVSNYGKDTETIIRRNPYVLMNPSLRLKIGFFTADKIAMALGMEPLDIRRLEAGVLHCLSGIGGDTYVNRDLLFSQLTALLDIDSLENKEFQKAIHNLIDRNLIVTEGKRVFLAKLHAVEVNIAERLIELKKNATQIDKSVVNLIISEYEEEVGKPLNIEQKRAVINAAVHGVSVITGNPGTGKTHVIACLVRLFEALGRNIVLCSPTGKSARRIEESTGRESWTIHMLLGASGPTGTSAPMFRRNEENPLDADTVIVDEGSMVDVYLMNALLSAINPENTRNTRLILVGDSNQIPSIGPGQVLSDIISSLAVGVTRLIDSYRTDLQDILENAKRINRGDIDLVPSPKEPLGSFYVVNQVSNSVVVQMVREIMNKAGLRLEDIKVITPYKRESIDINTRSLNHKLQEEFNPGIFGGFDKAADGSLVKRTTEIIYRRRRFRVGDPVIQLENNYTAKVMNGDLGIITETSIIGSNVALRVQFDNGVEQVYSNEELLSINLAYALTVHKVQGSEFKAVVVVLPKDPAARGLLKRALLYTGITRAQRLAVLIGTDEAIETAITETDDDRNTSLAERLVASSRRKKKRL